MRHTIFALMSALFLPAIATAASYDALADWNPTTNTTANIWQYGTETTPGGTLTLFSDHNSNTSAPTYDLWDLNNSANIVGPFIGFNSSGGTIDAGGGPNLLWPSNILQIAPSSSLDTVLRWDAPSTGSFNITGRFTDLQQSRVTLYVQSNGTTIFSGSFSGASAYQADVPFSLSNVPVTQGQDIDFIVDGGGSSGNDSEGISATITQSVPEPASLALLGMSGLLVLRRRRA